MAYLGPVHRWDIFWADLDEVVGREQAGSRRPVLIVSNDALILIPNPGEEWCFGSLGPRAGYRSFGL